MVFSGDEWYVGRVWGVGFMMILDQRHLHRNTNTNIPPPPTHLLPLVRPPQALGQEHVPLLRDGLLVPRAALRPPEEVAGGDEAWVDMGKGWCGGGGKNTKERTASVSWMMQHVSTTTTHDIIWLHTQETPKPSDPNHAPSRPAKTPERVRRAWRAAITRTKSLQWLGAMPTRSCRICSISGVGIGPVCSKVGG